jgi:hypothetical protein
MLGIMTISLVPIYEKTFFEFGANPSAGSASDYVTACRDLVSKPLKNALTILLNSIHYIYTSSFLFKLCHSGW